MIRTIILFCFLSVFMRSLGQYGVDLIVGGTNYIEDSNPRNLSFGLAGRYEVYEDVVGTMAVIKTGQMTFQRDLELGATRFNPSEERRDTISGDMLIDSFNIEFAALKFFTSKKRDKTQGFYLKGGYGFGLYTINYDKYSYDESLFYSITFDPIVSEKRKRLSAFVGLGIDKYVGNKRVYIEGSIYRHSSFVLRLNSLNRKPSFSQLSYLSIRSGIRF